MSESEKVSMIETMRELHDELDRMRYHAAETQASWEEYQKMMARKAKYEKLQDVLKNL